MRINWQLLETHKETYTNECVFCGGKCTDEKAIIERQRALNELGKTTKGNRQNYLSKRYKKTLNYSITW